MGLVLPLVGLLAPEPADQELVALQLNDDDADDEEAEELELEKLDPFPRLDVFFLLVLFFFPVPVPVLFPVHVPPSPPLNAAEEGPSKVSGSDVTRYEGLKNGSSNGSEILSTRKSKNPVPRKPQTDTNKSSLRMVLPPWKMPMPRAGRELVHNTNEVRMVSVACEWRVCWNPG